MDNFKDKVAVVTGAGNGIGRALALELASRGCHVAVSDINLAAAQETADGCRALGVRSTGYGLDVSDRAAFEAHAEQVKQDFGGANLLFNNAGVALMAKIVDMRWEDFEWLMGINFWGVAYGTRAFLPLLIASGNGYVVNVSSVLGLIAMPKQSAYSSAKFAVRGYTDALRMEMRMSRKPVRVSCVLPGGIRTNIARAARFGEKDRDRDLDKDFAKITFNSPERAAKVILSGVQRNKAHILVGFDARLYDLMPRLFGSGYQAVVRALARPGY